jgi:hypothetical protein
MGTSRDCVVVEARLHHEFAAVPELPADIGELTRALEPWQGVASLLSPIAEDFASPERRDLALDLVPPTLGVDGPVGGVPASGMPRAMHSHLEDLREGPGVLAFRTVDPRPVTTSLALAVVVLRRDDGTLDVVLDSRLAYAISPAAPFDMLAMQALYRDVVRFDVVPRDPDLALDPLSVAPARWICDATYQYNHTWTRGRGFVNEAPRARGPVDIGADASGVYRFCCASSRLQPDFDVVHTVGGPGISFTSTLNHVYDDDARHVPYSFATPDRLIRRDDGHLGLRDVPSPALDEIERAYLCGFTLPASAAGRVVTLDLYTQQQLQHAAVCPLQGAVVLPAYFNTRATLVIDLAQGTARIAEPRACFLHLGQATAALLTCARFERRDVALRAYDIPGHVLRHDGTRAIVAPVLCAQHCRDSTLQLLQEPGAPTRVWLAAKYRPGYLYRVHDGQLELTHALDDPAILDAAAFTLRPGLADRDFFSLESAAEPGRFLRHRDFDLLVESDESDAAFRAEATFQIATALA